LTKALIAIALIGVATNFYLNSTYTVNSAEERFVQFI
jgi:cathepsin L